MQKSVLWLVIVLAAWACSPAAETTSEAPAPSEPAPAQQPAAKADEVDMAVLKQKLDAGEDIFLLDVRTPAELEEHGMIAGAVNIPIDDLEARMAEVPKDKPIVTYCMRGSRGSRAAELLRSNGYDQPIESGGITAWKEAGYEVVQPENADQEAVADAMAEPRSDIQESPVATAAAAPLRFGFDDDAVGGVPGGFTPEHSGRGAKGRWEVVQASDAPSDGQAVAQIDPDRTGYRFPLLVLDAVTARDVELSVAGKPISGTKDQAIGLIWRYQDPDNYYVVRANALEDNVVLYKVERGERSDLPLVGKGRTYGVDVEVPGASWSSLSVRVREGRFTVFFNGRELFAVEDDTFPSAGKVGLWTKADSVTWFDDLEVVVLDAPAAVDAAAASATSTYR